MKFLTILVTSLLVALAVQAADTRPRLLVLTDIGGDPDDQQSMIRLMVFANEFDIEGLIATASGTPGELKDKVTKPELIRKTVEAYAQVRPKLVQHARGYPTEVELMAVIKAGNPNRSIAAVGEGQDTEGSNWIITSTDEVDPRPLNITIWGGQTDLAQALWRVRNDRGEDGYRTFISKLRIYDIDDQDKMAEWIWQKFPGLYYILAKAPRGQDKRLGAYRGIYLGGDESLTSSKWINEHVKMNHGPLGALYPMKTYTAPNPNKTMKEGDTPSWFFFLRNGLGNPAHPDWGSWGGRFKNDHDQIFRDASDTVNGVTEGRASVWRWRQAFQNEFAARMDWCVKTFEEANHHPKITVNGKGGQDAIHLMTKPGNTIILDAAGTSDPDKDLMLFNWWIYQEPSTAQPTGTLENASTTRARLKIPKETKAGEIHVVLEVMDDGTPGLTNYRRVVVEVKP